MGSNGMGIAAMILGLISLAICWIPFVGLFCILPMILAIIAIAKDNGKGMGIVGLICAIIALIIQILMLTLLASFFADLFSGFGLLG